LRRKVLLFDYPPVSPKRLIIVFVLLLAVATVLVGFAAGGSENKRSPKKQSRSDGAVHGAPTMGPRETASYWTRERMKNARPMPMIVPGGSSKSLPSGSGGKNSPAKPPTP
jgi:hypothetical protein